MICSPAAHQWQQNKHTKLRPSRILANMNLSNRNEAILSLIAQSSDIAEQLALARELHENLVIMNHQEDEQATETTEAPVSDSVVAEAEPPKAPEIPREVFEQAAEPETEISEDQIQTASDELGAARSIHEKLSTKQNPHTLADKLKQNGQPTIKSMLDLNGKIGLANDFFGGNMNECNSFIERLDQSASLDVALSVLNQIANQDKLEENKTLVELVHKRFA